MSPRTLPPPDPAAPGPAPGWGVRRAARRSFPAPAALAADPAHAARLERFLSDLLRPYGLRPAPADGRGQSYGEMGEALIADVVPPGEEVDLLVLAHAVPDLAPGRATACRLGHVCPGRPLALAVTDESGPLGGAALRLLHAYAREGGLRRALLLLLEQDRLPHRPDPPAHLPPASRGVALLFGDPPPGGPPPAPAPPPPVGPGLDPWWSLAAPAHPAEDRP
ncbi:hypothetical protein ACIQBJ_15965 [Kitasatospora sp. NPDC088391]|uniref:hypothetical protein n=1 Tax=Kitasatospora sp. NPDC088391 TaxID=3364074 RepID=UPI0038163C82